MTREEFFATFELFAELPDAVAQLRALILRLAVRGQLVGQNDGEASAKQIFANVSSASTTGRYSTPESWVWVPFSAVGEQRLGKMLDQKGNRGNLRPYLRNTNVQWMRFDLDDIKQLRLEPSELDEYRLRDGDLLICEGGEPGRCAIWRGELPEMYFQKALHRVRPREGVLSEYLAISLHVDAHDGVLVQHFTGATIKHLTGRSLSEYSLAIPPLAEQKRIVAKVNELMALCDQLEAQQKERETRHAALSRASLSRFAAAPTPANLPFLFHNSYTIAPADLRKTILELAVLGRLVSNSRDVPLVSLDSILAEASVNGVSRGPTSDMSATEILRISAGTSRHDFYVDEDDFKHVNLPPADVEKYRLDHGDLLACRFNGNLHYVGRFSVYRGESHRVQVNPDKLIRFRVDPTRCSPRYVCYAMNASPTRTSIEAMCATTAGNIGLSAGRLKTVEIPLPPLAEQRGIVAKVDELLAIVDDLEAQLMTSRDTATTLLDAIVGEFA